jgi:hypothetical protein
MTAPRLALFAELRHRLHRGGVPMKTAIVWVTDPDARQAPHLFDHPTGANEPWATCPRVIGQEPRLRKPRSVAKHWGSKMEIAVFVCLIVLLTALPVFFAMR